MKHSMEHILESVQKGELSVEDAMEKLKPQEELGYATLDLQREVRTGFPEVIYGEGKTSEQIFGIFIKLMEHHDKVLATRVSIEKAKHVLEKLRANHPTQTFYYHESARTLYWINSTFQEKWKKGYVAVVCAGTSDLPVAEEAAITAELMGNKVERIYDIGVAGIHRLLNKARLIEDANVVIVVAGMEGALASVVGGLVSKPVIAVPTSVGYGASMNGIAALLAMLSSCASGVSVVNIDNGFGAGYFAATLTNTIDKALEKALAGKGESE
ncbi:nickel pincer cofactor biosynthesis protein LarB [Lederbergia wuyishanensis]|uniref:NCAIR mutase (PurE)-related protein n=1 Tax=Lederbergia wuyishanensis TaxID=1347903 RepID=A0ABU0D9U1_9BACI|nr:nickel pincer cofactor biosynthesis protein LarB [Lederbergia wuyishanensis]MCJ8008454.1 nickel pincer cofactor biosynthesis protein LarB [Lederbergia wuyishanensis]MDQ0345197.1 NCAIR mutase (PurE)-related protein [Lederbergia wuyishanensis]